MVEAPKSLEGLLAWYKECRAEIDECPAPQRPVLQKLLDKQFASFQALLRTQS